MASVGGSIESVSLDGRNFAVAADADVSRKKGGYENEVQANGDGTARLIKTRVPFMLSGLVVEVDDSRGDHEFLQDLANANDYFPITVTYASGVVYQGSGQIVGEVQVGNQSQTASIDLAGQQALTPQ